MPHVAHDAPAFHALTGRGELLAAAHERLGEGPGVLLSGPAGIGKSTLLAALAAGAADGGATVLRCSPAPEDARLPYLGVIDLFARVPAEVVTALPPGPRAALRAALLPGWEAAEPGGFAVRVAVLEALRLLAGRGPLVLAVDGLQWLDEPSAEVLAFVARRIEDTGVRVLAAERVSDGEQPRRARCCPPGTAEIGVPPLTDDDISLLLLSSGAALPPSVLRAVQQTAAGNPCYALALGRAAPRDGLTAEAAGFLPVPEHMRALLLDRVRALPAAALSVLLVAAAAAHPTLALLRAAGLPGVGVAVAEAERLGVLVTDVSGALRFRHPMLRAAVYADAPGQARGRAHALLAVAAGEPLERARHLAFSRPHEDESVAAALMAAVTSAALPDPPPEPAAANRPQLQDTHPFAPPRPPGNENPAPAVTRGHAELIALREPAEPNRDPSAPPQNHSPAPAVTRGHAELSTLAELAKPNRDPSTPPQNHSPTPAVTRGHAELSTLAELAKPNRDPSAPPQNHSPTPAVTRGHAELSTLAELAELAARRTPAGLEVERDQRLLVAAEFACDAGRREESERAAGAVLAGSGSARNRVRARLVLLRNAGQALWDKDRLIDAGLRDAAGDPALEAALYHWAALRGLLCGELGAAANYARRSVACAALSTATDTHLDALSTLARVHSLAGHPTAADAALTQALTLAPHARPLLRMRAILDLDADRLPRSRTHLDALFSSAEPPPPAPFALEDMVASLVVLVRVQVRAGECREAKRSAARCLGAAGGGSGPAVYAAALAETFGGRTGRARELAARAVAASEAAGDRLFLLRALAVQGQAALFGGDKTGAAEAVESLRRVLEIGTAMRAADPPLLSWYADLAEALVTLGEPAAAAEVLTEAYRWVTPQTPGSVRASLERAQGLRAAATGHAKEGAALLLNSAERLRPLGLPVDLVRTLTALGAVERRARHRTAARTALTEALHLADRTGATPLAARARDELARVDAATRGADGAQLTPAEARIVELVRGGATNREVATALFISVKTVEGTLSRLFRKFGVRSRTALAHRVPQETHG